MADIAAHGIDERSTLINFFGCTLNAWRVFGPDPDAAAFDILDENSSFTWTHVNSDDSVRFKWL